MILKDRKSLRYIKELQPQFFDDMVNQNGTFRRVITHEETISRLTGIVDRWIDRQER